MPSSHYGQAVLRRQLFFKSELPSSSPSRTRRLELEAPLSWSIKSNRSELLIKFVSRPFLIVDSSLRQADRLPHQLPAMAVTSKNPGNQTLFNVKMMTSWLLAASETTQNRTCSQSVRRTSSLEMVTPLEGSPSRSTALS